MRPRCCGGCGLYLRNVWGVVDEWKKSATRKKKNAVSML
ncbi:unnamed protein product [Ectocarpus fasciculatus]